jgi:hypothetical protein
MTVRQASHIAKPAVAPVTTSALREVPGLPTQTTQVCPPSTSTIASHCVLRSHRCAPPPLQAEKFRSKAQKSDTWRVPAQYCRYLFYLGTIRAIQLEYSEAKEVLQQVG